MFERTNQQSSRRGEDDMLRRMLFGTNGSRRPMPAPQDLPVMEQVSPQSATGGMNGGAPDDALYSACINACSLAMVYSPVQEWQELFPIDRALCEGTLFRELAKPFKGKTLLGR